LGYVEKTRAEWRKDRLQFFIIKRWKGGTRQGRRGRGLFCSKKKSDCSVSYNSISSEKKVEGGDAISTISVRRDTAINNVFLPRGKMKRRREKRGNLEQGILVHREGCYQIDAVYFFGVIGKKKKLTRQGRGAAKVSILGAVERKKKEANTTSGSYSWRRAGERPARGTRGKKGIAPSVLYMGKKETTPEPKEKRGSLEAASFFFKSQERRSLP